MNSAKLVFFALCIGVLSISAIGGSAFAAGEEPTRTVDWYMAPENKAALDAKFQECRSNPGKLEDTPNCINAEEARYKIRIFKPPVQ